jgi:hypothetical protein
VLDKALQGREGRHIPADDLHGVSRRRREYTGLVPGELAEEREKGQGHWQPSRPRAGRKRRLCEVREGGRGLVGV